MISPLVKQLYIEKYGEEDYAENCDYQKESWWWWPFNQIELYAQVCQIGTLMTGLTLAKKQKAVHGNPGTFVTGRFELDPEAQKRFGLAQSRFPVSLRHNYADTAAGPLSKGAKSMAVDISGFLTLIMLSAPVAGFWNLPTFLTFFNLQGGRSQQQMKRVDSLLQKNPLIWEVYQGTPYYATSYLQLVYNTLMTYEYTTAEGSYLIRFRGTPKGAQSDDYLMPPEEVAKFWDGEYYEAQDKQAPANLFELDYQDRLEDKVTYTLEYQIRPLPTDSKVQAQYRHCMYKWGVPFHVLGTITIPPQELKQDKGKPFDLRQMFPGLGVVAPKDAYDPSTIAWLRLHVYPFIQDLRKVYGM